MSNYNVVLGLKDNLTGGLTKATDKLKGFTKSLGSDLVAMGSIAGVVAGIKELTSAFVTQEQSNRQVNDAVFDYGSKLGYVQDQIDGLYNDILTRSTQLQDTSVFGDEDLNTMQSMALQAGITADNLDVLSKSCVDLTSHIKGADASGEDLQATQKALTKAIMSGSVNGLKRLQINLNEVEEQAFKTGNQTERLAILQKHSFNGAGESIRNTLGGSLKAIENNIGDIVQEIARLTFGVASFEELGTAMQPLVNLSRDLRDALGSAKSPLEGLNKAFSVMCEFSQPLTVIVTTLGIFVAIMGTLNVAVALFNALCAVNPLTWVILAVIAVVVALIVYWDDLCNGIKNAWDWGVNCFKDIAKAVVDLWSSTPIGMLINGLTGLAGKTIRFILGSDSDDEKAPSHATGTSYFRGGLTHVNEHGGELITLPSGSQILPSDKTDKMLSGGQTFNIPITIQGNVIGNEEYANSLGDLLVSKLQTAMSNC